MRDFLILFFFIASLGQAQDPLRFRDEVAGIQKKYDTLWNPSKETIVFTGSSSIRLWRNLETMFPDHHIVNTGFGSSLASDLLVYTNELVLDYHPKKVFIYEGDNDISGGKKPREIRNTMLKIIEKIRKKNDAIEIVFIAAKPSITRWHLKKKYKRLNRKLKRLAKKTSLVEFADVWKPMVERRKVKQDIFFEDGLHMNAKGYDIWFAVIKPFMN